MKVNLPEPCHEDWNKMDSQEKGRFCGSCEKLVIDFSVMSDIEIVNYFKEYKGQNTCGHFKKNQINRHLDTQLKEKETPRRKLFLKELAAACFAFFLASTDAKAQGGVVYTDEEIEQIKEERNQKKALENQGKEIAINGKIINDKEVLSNAIISIKGTEHKTVSLENGLFSIYVPFEIAQNQEFVILVVECEGLETKEIEVKTSPTSQFIEVDFEEKEPTFIASFLENDNFQTLGYTVTTLDSITVKGTITDEIGEMLIGATVLIKGTNQSTITGMDGNYVLTNIPQNATLVFIAMSYEEKQIELKTNQTILNVILLGSTCRGTVHPMDIEKIPKRYFRKNIWHRIKNIFR